MNKKYQKRLEKQALRLKMQNLQNPCSEGISLGYDLDAILALPQPLRELTLVKAMCEAFKGGHTDPLENSKQETPLMGDLSAWKESDLERDHNQQN